MIPIVPETSSAIEAIPTNPYDGLPKPPIAPPLKAAVKLSSILCPAEIRFPAGMDKYLGKHGVDLKTLQFDTKRLLVGSVRGGNLSRREEGFE
jgi:hypothetical protein